MVADKEWNTRRRPDILSAGRLGAKMDGQQPHHVSPRCPLPPRPASGSPPRGPRAPRPPAAACARQTVQPDRRGQRDGLGQTRFSTQRQHLMLCCRQDVQVWVSERRPPKEEMYLQGCSISEDSSPEQYLKGADARKPFSACPLPPIASTRIYSQGRAHMRPAAPQATGKKMCIRRSFARLDSLALMTMDADATAKGIAERRATCDGKSRQTVSRRCETMLPKPQLMLGVETTEAGSTGAK